MYWTGKHGKINNGEIRQSSLIITYNNGGKSAEKENKMTNELNARYQVASISTKDGEFARRVKKFTDENNVSHESIYRRGFESYEKEMAEKA